MISAKATDAGCSAYTCVDAAVFAQAFAADSCYYTASSDHGLYCISADVHITAAIQAAAPCQ
eukprot:14224-Heterococcus_DN1.PRE.3